MIDFLIPVHIKDIKTLEACIVSIKMYVQDTINNIYIVSVPDQRILDICDKLGCIYVDDKYLFNDLDLSSIRKDKRGWVFQQLIKLHNNICSEENYVVFDSDIVLTHPITFSGPIFYINNFRCWESYHKMNTKLVGYCSKEYKTFVVDYMIFNKEIVNQLHKKIEEFTGDIWYKSIIKNYDNSVEFGFSEFELYGLIYGDRPHKEEKRRN